MVYRDWAYNTTPNTAGRSFDEPLLPVNNKDWPPCVKITHFQCPVTTGCLDRSSPSANIDFTLCLLPSPSAAVSLMASEQCHLSVCVCLLVNRKCQSNAKRLVAFGQKEPQCTLRCCYDNQYQQESRKLSPHTPTFPIHLTGKGRRENVDVRCR